MGRRIGLACMAASAPDGPPLVMSVSSCLRLTSVCKLEQFSCFGPFPSLLHLGSWHAQLHLRTPFTAQYLLALFCQSYVVAQGNKLMIQARRKGDRYIGLGERHNANAVLSDQDRLTQLDFVL